MKNPDEYWSEQFKQSMAEDDAERWARAEDEAREARDAYLAILTCMAVIVALFFSNIWA